MKFHHTNFGFTAIELIIVISILGLLGTLSAQAMFQMYERGKYEKFVYTIQNYTSTARNMSLVNQAEYNSGSDSYSDMKNHGVFIEKNSASGIVSIRLFQDSDNDGRFDSANDSVLKSESSTVSISMENFIGTEHHSSSTINDFASIEILFQPDPDPESTLIAIDSDDNDITLRSIELVFLYIGDNTQNLRKKFTFDTISKTSEVTSTPIITDAEIIDDDIILTTNEDLSPLSGSFPVSNFTVSQDTTNYTVNSGSVSGNTITLSFASSLPSSGNDISVIFTSTSSITTTDDILLQPRKLTIPLP